MPQALRDVPSLQLLFSQHPLAQVEGPQDPEEGTQTPAWHFSLLLQALHVSPPEPQALADVPLLHCLFWQQPVQLLVPQEPEVGTQEPLMHFSVLLHILHAPPPVPQELRLIPPIQVVPRQQPVAQLEAPQVWDLSWHSPSLHCSVALHTLHP